jgi:ribosomal protein S18 acetylase RimI-like enzyme
MEEHWPDIRPLCPSDAAAYRQLRLQAIADAPTAVWPTHAEEAGRTAEEIAGRIARTESQVVFGAFVGARLVGIAGLRREPLAQTRHKAVLWGVFVSPERRREGFARRLLGHVLGFAREWGVLQVHLCVNADNDRARALYGALGFEPFGLEPRAMRVGDRYFDEAHMVLRLDG